MPLDRKEFGWTVKNMSKFMVTFGILGLLTQYIAVPLLTERCRMRDSTLGAIALLTASGSSVITAFATEEWHIWVAGAVSFLGVATTTSIRSNITKIVGPFEVGAVFSILATFQANNFLLLLTKSKAKVAVGLVKIIKL